MRKETNICGGRNKKIEFLFISMCVNFIVTSVTANFLILLGTLVSDKQKKSIKRARVLTCVKKKE